jgi:hypothetical protein
MGISAESLKVGKRKARILEQERCRAIHALKIFFSHGHKVYMQIRY